MKCQMPVQLITFMSTNGTVTMLTTALVYPPCLLHKHGNYLEVSCYSTEVFLPDKIILGRVIFVYPLSLTATWFRCSKYQFCVANVS